MPLYDVKCPKCGKMLVDVPLSLTQHDEGVICQNCKVKMEYQLGTPYVVEDYPGYQCPVTGKWIEGRKQHEENLRLQGCHVLEPGEKEANLAERARQEKELSDTIETSVGKAIEALSPAQFERLGNEIDSGADITVERRDCPKPCEV